MTKHYERDRDLREQPLTIASHYVRTVVFPMTLSDHVNFHCTGGISECTWHVQLQIMPLVFSMHRSLVAAQTTPESDSEYTLIA